jgi:hypothetical protein
MKLDYHDALGAARHEPTRWGIVCLCLMWLASSVIAFASAAHALFRGRDWMTVFAIASINPMDWVVGFGVCAAFFGTEINVRVSIRSISALRTKLGVMLTITTSALLIILMVLILAGVTRFGIGTGAAFFALLSLLVACAPIGPMHQLGTGHRTTARISGWSFVIALAVVGFFAVHAVTLKPILSFQSDAGEVGILRTANNLTFVASVAFRFLIGLGCLACFLSARMILPQGQVSIRR